MKNIPDFLEIAPSKNPRYVLIPLPFDAGSSRPGSRFAPAAILKASQSIEWYDETLDVSIENLSYQTVSPLAPRRKEKTRAYLDRVREAAVKAHQHHSVPVGVGGEHTLLVPLVEALVASRKSKDFSVVVFDAHSDLREDYEGNPWSHACSTRRIVEMGLDATVVGLRSLLPEHRKAGARLIFPEDIRSGRWKSMMAEVKRSVYVSIDVDVLDLGILPAATNPEPGGLSWDEFSTVLTHLMTGRHFLAGDVVELCPPAGPAYAAVTAARVLTRLIALAEKSRTR